MSYTYNEPDTTGVFPDSISEIRFLLSDVNPSAPYSLTDNEIQYQLAIPNITVRYAAANCAARMGRKYGAAALNNSVHVGDLTLTQDFKTMQQQFHGLAAELRSAKDLTAGTPGGPIYDQGDAVINPTFYVGQFDNKLWGR